MMMSVLLFSFAALFVQISCGSAAATGYGTIATEQVQGYIRVSVNPCDRAVQLLIEGERSETWHFPASTQQQETCIPVVTDSSSMLNDRVTLVASSGTKVDVVPNVFEKGYNWLYADRTECDAGAHNDVEITCSGMLSKNHEVAHHASDVDWQNGYDKDLYVSCPEKYAIYRVRSQHSNGAEDRQWKWDCTKASNINFDHCYWHNNYINSFDKPVLHMCAPNDILTGVKSYHDNDREDRKWNFKCCHSDNYYTKDCYASGFINDYDKWMDYNTNYSKDAPRVFVGTYSEHDNGPEDRRWKIISCEYEAKD